MYTFVLPNPTTAGGMELIMNDAIYEEHIWRIGMHILNKRLPAQVCTNCKPTRHKEHISFLEIVLFLQLGYKY